MSSFADSLGALLLMGVACIAWHRAHLAKLTWVAAPWTVGALYYSLEWPLLYKTALLLLVPAPIPGWELVDRTRGLRRQALEDRDANDREAMEEGGLD